MSDLERRIRAIEDVGAIERLKYRYWRCLDLKLWDELADCFAPDATVSYGDGKYSFTGRDEIMKFLRESLAVESGSVTLHHGHHPEITLTGEDTATGVFALDNYLFNDRANRSLRMGAYYEDRFVRLEGAWRIQHSGYRLIFQEDWQRSDWPTLSTSVPLRRSK
jgi:bile-acid 7alpha-dehydratase